MFKVKSMLQALEVEGKRLQAGKELRKGESVGGENALVYLS